MSRGGRGRTSRRTRPGTDSISPVSTFEISLRIEASWRAHCESAERSSSVRTPRTASWMHFSSEVTATVRPRLRSALSSATIRSMSPSVMVTARP